MCRWLATSLVMAALGPGSEDGVAQERGTRCSFGAGAMIPRDFAQDHLARFGLTAQAIARRPISPKVRLRAAGLFGWTVERVAHVHSPCLEGGFRCHPPTGDLVIVSAHGGLEWGNWGGSEDISTYLLMGGGYSRVQYPALDRKNGLSWHGGIGLEGSGRNGMHVEFQFHQTLGLSGIARRSWSVRSVLGWQR